MSSKKRSNVIRFKTTMHNCTAFRSLVARGWSETHDEYDWDFYWADVNSVNADSGFDHSRLKDHQRVNHFPRHVELTRKDLMVKNLKRMKRTLEKEGRGHEMDFYPQTYSLPAEYGIFAEEFRRQGGVWIVKPCGRAQGRGIFLLDKLSQVNHLKKKDEPGLTDPDKKAEIYVVSRYIDRPMLIGGKKFDLRIFALVLSYSPLKVYLYRGGFCRFTSARYMNPRENIKDMYIHLTNTAVQKKGETYDRSVGLKWPMDSLKRYMASRHGADAANRCFQDIQLLIIRSLLAAQYGVTQDKHCFELYGYDVMIDELLKPWLIEVNASPSLIPDTNADFRMKYSLVDDCISLVDVDGKLGAHVPQTLGGFDLIYHNGDYCQVHPSLPSLLGTDLPMAKNMPERRRRKKKEESTAPVDAVDWTGGLPQNDEPV